MPLLKNGYLEKIETWHVGLSCQYTHFMSFSSKSEHDTVADQATLTENRLNRNEMCCASNNHNYMCHTWAKEFLKFELQLSSY